MTLFTIILMIFIIPFVSAQETLISTSDVPMEAAVANGVEVLPGLMVSAKSIDLGDVFFGTSIEQQFTLTNTSENTIQIINIRTDCGCESRLNDDSPIPAGDSRTLTVKYVPEFRTGKVTKRITIYTDIENDNTPEKWFELSLKASIQSVVNLEPGHVYFKKVLAGESATETLKITSLQGNSVQILKSENQSEHMSVELQPVPEASGTDPQWLLTLTLKETAPVGKFVDTVTLTTNSDHQKIINIAVLGFIRGTVSVRPTQCYLGTLTPGESVKKTLKVTQKAEEADLPVPVIAEPPDWMTYTVITEVEGKNYTVELTFNVPENKIGRFGGTFTVSVNHPSLKEFEIPVFGYVLDPKMIKADDKKEDSKSQDIESPK